MMIQKTKTKQKTIDEIAPLWSKAFDLLVNTPTSNKGWCDECDEHMFKNHLMMSKYNRCFVGEAWRFDLSYVAMCEKCYHFAANEFVKVYSRLEFGRHENWREIEEIKSFVEHFNARHI